MLKASLAGRPYAGSGAGQGAGQGGGQGGYVPAGAPHWPGGSGGRSGAAPMYGQVTGGRGI